MPGGALVPAAGITMIGLEPTHRRRGILTEMLGWLHDDAARRGEVVALLTASESSIYRRFGYGIAMDVAHLSIAADAVRFDPPVDDPGSFVPVDPGGDTSEIEAIFDRVRRARTGWLSLSPGMWAEIWTDLESNRRGRTPLRGVVHRDAAGTADGYATWRIAQEFYELDRLAANTLYLEQLVGTSPEVEAALWSFLASIDLVTTVVWEVGPREPTIRRRLVEPRRLRTLASADMVWARLLDVEATLSARTYGAPGTLDLDVTDRTRPECGGRFRLTSADRGEVGICKRLDRTDSESAGTSTISLDTADLASATIGGVAPSELAAAGRVTGDATAIDLADALFALADRPWWPIEF